MCVRVFGNPPPEEWGADEAGVLWLPFFAYDPLSVTFPTIAPASAPAREALVVTRGAGRWARGPEPRLTAEHGGRRVRLLAELRRRLAPCPCPLGAPSAVSRRLAPRRLAACPAIRDAAGSRR
jgi:hypothetical protein